MQGQTLRAKVLAAAVQRFHHVPMASGVSTYVAAGCGSGLLLKVFIQHE